MRPENAPLKTLEELSQWTPRGPASPADAPQRASPGLQSRCGDTNAAMEKKGRKHGRVLACHDMMGGYKEDKYPQGDSTSSVYYLVHWRFVDVFVYFSHGLVTIPPTGWINAAHRNNVKVLGTFITEWEDGIRIADQLLSSPASAHAHAMKLAQIAKYYNFDGWLINIENKIVKEKIPNMIHFLKTLSNEIHLEIPGSIVLWYDSVTVNGDLDWQDVLNDLNKPFFDSCDGIFTNYSWKDDMLRYNVDHSVNENRNFDVFVGVDVYVAEGRYGKGFKSGAQAQKALELSLSAAIFAPAWVYETNQPPSFPEAQARLWYLIGKNLEGIKEIASPFPFYSNFDQGVGKGLWIEGSKVFNFEWSNFSSQSFQPLYHYFETSDYQRKEYLKSNICYDNAFDGGCSIQIQGNVFCRKYFSIPLFRFFAPIRENSKSLCVSYSISGSNAVDSFLTIAVENEGKKFVYILGDGKNETDFGMNRKINGKERDNFRMREEDEKNEREGKGKELGGKGETVVLDDSDNKSNVILTQEKIKKLRTKNEWNVMEYEIDVNRVFSSSSSSSTPIMWNIYLTISAQDHVHLTPSSLSQSLIDNENEILNFLNSKYQENDNEKENSGKSENSVDENMSNDDDGKMDELVNKIQEWNFDSNSNFGFEIFLGHVSLSDSLCRKNDLYTFTLGDVELKNPDDDIARGEILFSGLLTWETKNISQNSDGVSNIEHENDHGIHDSDSHFCTSYDVFIFNAKSDGESSRSASQSKTHAHNDFETDVHHCNDSTSDDVCDSVKDSMSKFGSVKWIGVAHVKAFQFSQVRVRRSEIDQIQFGIWPKCVCGVRAEPIQADVKTSSIPPFE